MEDEIEYYSLTHPQKSIWYTEKMYSGTSIGNIAASMRIMGNVDYELLAKAINIFIERNDAIRLQMVEIDGQPRQYVSEYTYHKLDFCDFSGKDITELYKWDEEQTKIPFKLIDSELFYFALFKISNNEGGFYAKFHHFISDAWTMSLLGNQVIECYSALKNGQDVLIEMKPSYVDYVLSEEEYEKSKRFEKDREFWNNKFEVWHEVTTLKIRKSNDFSTKARRKALLVPKKLTAKIHEYCQEKGVSEFTLFCAALSMYINRVTAKEDLTLGTTLLNRSNASEKDTAGMFASIAVPMRIHVKDDMNLNSFVEIISKETLSIFRHQKYPYDLLLKDIRERHKISGSLFDIVLNYQNSKFNKAKHTEEYVTRWHFRGYQVEQLIIHISDREDDGHLIVDYDYLTHLFHATEIEFIHQHIINLLWHALDNPEKVISRLEMLSEKEKHKVLYEFNEVDRSKDKVVQKLLEDNIIKLPDDTKLYILDKNNNLLPIGIPGELCVGGNEISGENLNKDELVQEKFMSNPFIADGKLYKTGKLARWYPKGEIEHFGEIEMIEAAKSSNIKKEVEVRVAATYTAEPIGDYIKWWGSKFGHKLKVEFARYNQVFQELLNPDSKLSKNKDGINIVLVKFEDFIRDDNGSDELKILKLEKIFGEFQDAISKFSGTAPFIIPIFPVPTHLNLNSVVNGKINELNTRFEEIISKYNNAYLINLNEIQDLYNIEEVFDSIKDKEGHMPFTDEFYAAMGTEIARKIVAIKKQHFKVIVLDCDNTLWKGICGEQGVLGVKIEGAYKELQEFMLQKYNEGMLLAVCSKNNEKDVFEVFDKNPDMILQRKHIINWKICWDEKSQSIKETAKELNLGLDSFIFIDDSPVECSKMVKNCPEVLTLQLPLEEEYISLFLKHVWAFDRVKVTKEDLLRSSMYEAEKARQEVSAGILLDDFIKNLDLKVSIREISSSEVARAAQMTQRTNQFNLSTIRRSEQEITQLMEDRDTKCFVIEASDKFGDYGIVGLIILKEEKDKLFIDTFLLSCRILGRKAEDVILSGIRKYTEERSKGTIEAVFIPTEKNKPMLEFIEKTKWNIAEKSEKYTRYIISVNDLPKEIENISFYYNEMYEKGYKIEVSNEKEIFVLDHIAVAVKNVKESEEYYKKLGFSVSNSVYDQLQNSYLSICKSERYLPIEFVAPVNNESPSYNLVQAYDEIPYHLCYKVPSIKSFLEKIKDVEYELISDEKPAVLFNKQKVAFIMIKKVGLIELVEAGIQISNKNKNYKFKNNIIKLVVNNLDSALLFYKKLGYIEEKNVKDIKNNSLEVVLVGHYGEKIELIAPLSKDTIEFEFLKRNGAGIYQLHFGISKKDEYKISDLKDKKRKYNVFFIAEENERKITTDFTLYNTEILEKTIHKEHILAISNSTGRKLLQLPIYEGTSYVVSEYEAPRNEIEEKVSVIWENVLKTKKVGINNDFFVLGGDSLDAVAILSRIHKELNVELTLKDFFEASNIKKLAKKIVNSNVSEYEEIKTVEKKDYYEVSSAQKRMYILNEIEKGETVYNECHSILIEGKLDKVKLENAVKQFINRHEILRTGFEILNGEPIQRIYDEIKFEIEYIKAKKDEVKEISKNFVCPFNLSKLPLIRMKLLEIGTEKHILLLDVHHIVIDGASFAILVKELLALYEGKGLEPLKIQYKDFASWQNQLFKSDKITKQREFWLDHFKGEIPVLNMPTDFVRPAVQSFNGSKKYFKIDKSMLDKLIKVCDKTETTLFMLLFSAFNVLLYRYSGQEDIVVGTPVAGRTHADLKGVIGMFVNTLPIRTFPIGESKFNEYLDKVKETILMCLENQDFQYENLIEKLNIPRDISRNPLFDVMFALQNIDMPEIKTNNLKFTSSKIENHRSKFDLSLTAAEKNNEIEFEIEYCTDLFKGDTIDRLEEHFLNILNDITDNPEKLIEDIEILSAKEKNKILYEFNDTYADYPNDKTIHQLFEEQVERTPDNVAVVFENKHLTYRELNARANQLARVLRNKGVKPDTIIGIMVERSLEMIVGILGILKAGGAYLPIDPEYPDERIGYMLEDSGAGLLLAQKNLAEKVEFKGELIKIDNDSLFECDDKNLENLNKPSDLIYVIYTSGSTGKPKGVMLEHRNISNFITGITNRINFHEKDVILCITTISFDIFVLETWLPLSKGAKVILVNRAQQLDIGELTNVILENKVSMVQMTPSRMKLMLEDIRTEEVFKQIQTIMLGGEALPQSLFETLKNKTKAKIYNMYGPTETAVWSSVKDLTKETKVTIGEPIANTQFYILDKNHKIQPTNIPGELYIDGDGVARGYMNKEELTNEKFIQSPFVHGKKMYKTGDLVRLLKDGSIEYIDRIDDQVKIRGFRIELSEIRNSILSFHDIKDVAVLANFESGSNNLRCYFTSDKVIDVEQLRNYLLSKIPNYMIPSFFMQIESFPVTVNGKLDKKALLAMLVCSQAIESYVGIPTNDVEKIILNCWKDVLKNNNIGVNDNFFTVGGDSLNIITIISELVNYKLDLKMQHFYDYPTVRSLANRITGANSTEGKLESITTPTINNKFKKQISKKNIVCENILLTGATGFVGIHILKELIEQTGANIYCLLRGEYKKSKDRLIDLLHYYFKNNYDCYIDNRIFCINGDVSTERFGLSIEEYSKLGEKIDLVIHTAAIIKHQGNYADFEKINVNGTKEVVKFAKLFKAKLGHMSTISVSGDYVVKQKYPRPQFTEDNLFIGQNYFENVYIRSKFEAENVVITEMQKDLEAVIFRLGYITSRYSDGQFQKNSNENKFFNILRSIIEVGVIPSQILNEKLDFTPVDFCSKGIVKTLINEDTYGNVLHFYNSNFITVKQLRSMISKILKINIKVIENLSFNDYMQLINRSNSSPKAISILANDFNFEKMMLDDYYRVKILNDKTQAYISQLGFKWPQINEDYIKSILGFLIDTKYIDAV